MLLKFSANAPIRARFIKKPVVIELGVASECWNGDLAREADSEATILVDFFNIGARWWLQVILESGLLFVCPFDLDVEPLNLY